MLQVAEGTEHQQYMASTPNYVSIHTRPDIHMHTDVHTRASGCAVYKKEGLQQPHPLACKVMLATTLMRRDWSQEGIPPPSLPSEVLHKEGGGGDIRNMDCQHKEANSDECAQQGDPAACSSCVCSTHYANARSIACSRP